jgi:hypothetical protein
VLDPLNEDTLYASVLGGGSYCILELGPTAGIFVSYNYGDTWSGPGAGLDGVNVLALAPDPIAAGVVYAGTTHGVYRTENVGASWAPLGTGLADAVLSLAVDAEGPNCTRAPSTTASSGSACADASDARDQVRDGPTTERGGERVSSPPLSSHAYCDGR